MHRFLGAVLCDMMYLNSPVGVMAVMIEFRAFLEVRCCSCSPLGDRLTKPSSQLEDTAKDENSYTFSPHSDSWRTDLTSASSIHQVQGMVQSLHYSVGIMKGFIINTGSLAGSRPMSEDWFFTALPKGSYACCSVRSPGLKYIHHPFRGSLD